jgi:hypothetical protein
MAVRVEEHPEYPPQNVAAPGRPIVAPAARASSSTSSTASGEPTLWASAIPPQPPGSMTVESSASEARLHSASTMPPHEKKTTPSSALDGLAHPSAS